MTDRSRTRGRTAAHTGTGGGRYEDFVNVREAGDRVRGDCGELVRRGKLLAGPRR